MNPRQFNLNLLPVLDALLECRSVTKAGAKLNLSQPASSAALSKLRHIFSDELLVLVGREMQLTPKAERLREPLRQLLDLLDVAFEIEPFSPERWEGEFIIATADYASIVLLPLLLDRLEQEAPRLTVRLANVTRGSVANLRADEIDMIIGPPELYGDNSLMIRNLLTDQFVCVYWRGGAARREEISMEEYLAARHVTTIIDPIKQNINQNGFDKTLDSLRSTQRNSATLPYYAALPFLLADTDRFALVQERLARHMKRFLPIDYVSPPVHIPSISVAMMWSPRVNHDPAHMWIRKTLSEISAKLN